MPGWKAAEPDGRIELWQCGYLGVPAAVGEQFAEPAANGRVSSSRTYRAPGALLTYAVSTVAAAASTRWRSASGRPGARRTSPVQVSTGNTEWQQVLGNAGRRPARP